MVQQEIDVKSNTGFNRVLRLGGFLLSTVILYLMVFWTLELSQVRVGDLPVINALDVDFKKKPVGFKEEIVKNNDLSINSLRGKQGYIKSNTGLIDNSLEEELTNSEKPVPLSMKEALENSITEALNRLAQNEIITQEKVYKVYLGSYDSYEAAGEKLKVIPQSNKLSDLSIFSIIPVRVDEKIFFRLETEKVLSYENAKLLCDQLVADKLDCKVIKNK